SATEGPPVVETATPAAVAARTTRAPAPGAAPASRVTRATAEAGAIGIATTAPGSRPVRFLAEPLHQFLGHLGEEARGRVIRGRAPAGTGDRAADVKLFLRSGNAHVGQAAFLGKLRGVAQRPHVRELAILPAGEEYHRKLQPLGGVQGHQRDLTCALLWDLVGIGDQADPFQEG